METNRKRLILALSAILVAVLAAGGVWWATRDTTPAQPKKSDCQLASDMIDFYKDQVKEINAGLQAGTEGDAEYKTKMNRMTSFMEGFVKQISDPKIKSESQHVIDTVNDIQKLKEKYSNMPQVDPAHPTDVSPEMKQMLEEQQKLGLQQIQNLTALHESCPSIEAPPAPPSA